MTQQRGQSNLSVGKVEALVAQLNSEDETERVAAEQAIREMQREEIGSLFTTMDTEIDQWIFRGLICFVICTVILLAIYRLTSIIPLGRFEDFLRIAAIGLLVLPLEYIVFKYGMRPLRYKRLAQSLAKLDDIQYVGRLTRGLRIADKEIRPAVETALIRLLPRLQANGAAFLQDEPRRILRSLLNGPGPSGKNTELVLAALKAFEQVGGRKEIPIVKKLAAGKTKASRDYRVRQAAQECLLFLQERIEGHSPDSTLLRAAGTETSANVLLRPAGETQETDPQQLLRANVAATTAAQVQTITQENTHAQQRL